MSKMYSIDMILKVEPNYNNIEKLIICGKNMGIKFTYKDGEKESSTKETVDKLLNDFSHVDIYDINYDTGVTGIYKNMIFVLHIYNKDNNLWLSFLAQGYHWYKEIEDNKYFDFGRYVKFLIDLCEDFPIVKIKTEID